MQDLPVHGKGQSTVCGRRSARRDYPAILGGDTTTDKVYQLLYSPRQIDQQIGRINAKIRSLRDSLTLSGVRYDRDTVQSSPSDRMSAVTAEIDALERKRDALISSRMQAMEEIEEAIDRLEDDDENTVLYMQYIGCESMDEIAEKLHYSRRSAYRLRAQALKSLDRQV